MKSRKKLFGLLLLAGLLLCVGLVTKQCYTPHSPFTKSQLLLPDQEVARQALGLGAGRGTTQHYSNQTGGKHSISNTEARKTDFKVAAELDTRHTPWGPSRVANTAEKTPTHHSRPPVPPAPLKGGPTPPVAAAAPPRPRGYVLPLEFSEQMESGMYDLLQLAQLAHAWGMGVAEPYLRSSKFNLPTRPFNLAPSLVKLSHIYDITELNSDLRKSLNSPYDVIMSLKEIEADVRSSVNEGRGLHVVVLRLVPFSVRQEACRTSTDSKVLTDLSPLTHGCHNNHQNNHAPNNCLVTFACVNIREKTNFSNLLKTHPQIQAARKQMPGPAHGSKTLVLVPKWNGIRQSRDYFFYWDPSFPHVQFRHTHATRHSKWVLTAADTFRRRLQLKPPILGIHLRLERLLKHKPRNISKVRDCLRRMLSTVQDMLAGGQVSSAVLFRDYGTHGSNTCASIGCQSFADSSHLDQRVRGLGVKIETYSPPPPSPSYGGPLGGEREAGFIASVEQEALASTDKLLLVGYGSFQRGIAERFLRQHPSLQQHPHDNIFTICSRYQFVQST